MKRTLSFLWLPSATRLKHLTNNPIHLRLISFLLGKPPSCFQPAGNAQPGHVLLTKSRVAYQGYEYHTKMFMSILHLHTCTRSVPKRIGHYLLLLVLLLLLLLLLLLFLMLLLLFCCRCYCFVVVVVVVVVNVVVVSVAVVVAVFVVVVVVWWWKCNYLSIGLLCWAVFIVAVIVVLFVAVFVVSVVWLVRMVAYEYHKLAHLHEVCAE